MRAARGPALLALALALGSIGVFGCHHPRGRLGRRSGATSFAFTSDTTRQVLAGGYAELGADGVLRVVLTPAAANGCPNAAARGAGARVSFRVPAGPRLDHFVGATIGVRVDANELGSRGAFGLDAEEVSLRLARVDLAPGGVVAGRLTARERYRRAPGRSARGEGRFSVRLCTLEPRDAREARPFESRASATSAKSPKSPVSAHVVTLPDGRRALTKLRFGDGVLEHPSGAAEGRVQLGAPQPARLRAPDGTVGWDAWVRFDALDLAAGGHVRGAVDARAGDAWVRGGFDAIVEE